MNARSAKPVVLRSERGNGGVRQSEPIRPAYATRAAPFSSRLAKPTGCRTCERRTRTFHSRFSVDRPSAVESHVVPGLTPGFDQRLAALARLTRGSSQAKRPRRQHGRRRRQGAALTSVLSRGSVEPAFWSDAHATDYDARPAKRGLQGTRRRRWQTGNRPLRSWRGAGRRSRWAKHPLSPRRATVVHRGRRSVRSESKAFILAWHAPGQRLRVRLRGTQRCPRSGRTL